jgi:hypothetical protein
MIVRMQQLTRQSKTSNKESYETRPRARKSQHKTMIWGLLFVTYSQAFPTGAPAAACTLNASTKSGLFDALLLSLTGL